MTDSPTEKTLEQGVAEYCILMQKSYIQTYDGMSEKIPENAHYYEAQIKDYCDGMIIEPTQKYIKIWKGEIDKNGNPKKRSIAAFVVRANNVKTTKGGFFKVGDILKPASTAGPARNFARGNVLNRMPTGVRWTGA